MYMPLGTVERFYRQWFQEDAPKQLANSPTSNSKATEQSICKRKNI